MILPEPHDNDAGQRGKAFATTLLLGAASYGLLIAATYSVEKPTRKVYREVDLALFAPPAPVLEPGPPADASSPEPTPRPTPEPTQATVARALDEIDLAAFLPQELNAAEAEASPEPTRTRRQANAAAGVETSDALSGLGDLSALDGLGSPLPASGRARAGRGTGSSRAGADIALASGASAPDAGAGGVSPVGGDTRVVGGQQARQTASLQQGPAVERISLDALGDDYSNLEVRALIDWMKAHPADLPIGIRQLVTHRPSFLSSVASFTVEGRAYELYLMCKESLYEVHIVLVDREQATYLVDRSFQKLSTYLREGVVRRDGRDIVAVNSRRDAASNERSREFYGLFLSWWEQASAAN
jgi:hypothetical protein